MNGLKKMWYIHAMGYYSAIKKEILSYATTLLNLNDIMLSEIRQSKKDKHYMIPLHEYLKQSLTEIES